jgi:26S proteasome regulatory subunit N4
MGLPMDDLHTPAVPSGPSTRLQGSDPSLSKLSLMELVERRDRIEEELKTLGGLLDSVSSLGDRKTFQLTGSI